MPNTLLSLVDQDNINLGANVAHAASGANSGGNLVAGLIAINAGNPATSTAAALNVAPVTQTNIAIDPDIVVDADFLDFF
jgi:hypothetical protein